MIMLRVLGGGVELQQATIIQNRIQDRAFSCNRIGHEQSIYIVIRLTVITSIQFVF